MPEVAGLEAVAVDDEASVLSGEVVHDLVSRHEDEIEALVARVEEIEARAAAAERTVREHPGFALLDPDEAERLVPASPAPEPVDDGRPRTIVVRRSAPAGATAGRTDPSSSPPAGPADEAASGFLGRLATSHWWWRIGIALVVVAILLLKVG